MDLSGLELNTILGPLANQVQNYIDALLEIGKTGQYYHEEYPDDPASWSEKFTCRYCRRIAPSLESFERLNHHPQCVIAIARHALHGTKK